jgi:hypothetical protein
MNKQGNSYKKENDIPALSLCTDELLIINPQISHTSVTDSTGKHIGPDELILVVSVVNPVPEEEREYFKTDHNEPLIVSLENKDQADRLIKILQKLRTQIWGFNLNFENNIN